MTPQPETSQIEAAQTGTEDGVLRADATPTVDVVERSVVLDAPPADVRPFLDDESLLGLWLGDTVSDDSDTTRVRTDDGVVRVLERTDTEGDHIGSPDTVTWRWYPEGDADAVSDVRFVMHPFGSRTRLVVTEERTIRGVNPALTSMLSATSMLPSTSNDAGTPIMSLIALGASILCVSTSVQATGRHDVVVSGRR